MLSDRKIEERNARKAQILDGALTVFKTHGIEKTTMDQVAVESGFGKATLYYYYTSKDEVFIDIMEKGWKGIWSGIESLIVEEKNPKSKFVGIIKEISHIVKNDQNLYEFLFTAPNYMQDTSKQTWKTYQERLYAILKSIIDEGIKKKEFANIDPGILMKAIGGLFHTLFINNNDNVEDADLELMINNLLNPKT
tara:strand:- start:46 stop:627 length:582 start_codon:yes stop_codon:yes gene_type:complete